MILDFPPLPIPTIPWHTQIKNVALATVWCYFFQRIREGDEGFPSCDACNSKGWSSQRFAIARAVLNPSQNLECHSDLLWVAGNQVHKLSSAVLACVIKLNQKRRSKDLAQVLQKGVGIQSSLLSTAPKLIPQKLTKSLQTKSNQLLNAL